MIAAFCAGIAQADEEFERLSHGGRSIRISGLFRPKVAC